LKVTRFQKEPGFLIRENLIGIISSFTLRIYRECATVSIKESLKATMSVQKTDSGEKV